MKMIALTMRNKPMSRNGEIFIVRVAAGNFAYFCFFFSQIAYHFGLNILLGIATKGDIQFWHIFSRLLKKWIPCYQQKRKNINALTCGSCRIYWEIQLLNIRDKVLVMIWKIVLIYRMETPFPSNLMTTSSQCFLASEKQNQLYTCLKMKYQVLDRGKIWVCCNTYTCSWLFGVNDITEGVAGN